MSYFKTKQPLEILSVIKENSAHPENALFFSTLHTVIEKQISPSMLYIYSKGERKIAFIQQNEERAINTTSGTKEDGEAIAEFIFNNLGKTFIYGINAPEEISEGFSKKILALTRSKELSKRTLLLYSASTLVPPKILDFELCKYQEENSALAIDFMFKFWNETRSKEEMEKLGPEKALSTIKKMLNDGHSSFLSKNGNFLSFGSKSGATEYFEWVGPIFTPKEMRGQGYASAVTYLITKKILDDGKTAVLFTDSTNPTSNSIYQKLGYIFQKTFLRIVFTKDV